MLQDGLAQRVDADAAAAQAVEIDAGGAEVFLHQSPGHLAVEVPPLQSEPAGGELAERVAFRVVLDAGALDIGQHLAAGVEENRAAYFVPFLADVQIMLDAVGLQMAVAGVDDGRCPAAADEEDAHGFFIAFLFASANSGRLQSARAGDHPAPPG
jgi:hypothetical protein